MSYSIVYLLGAALTMLLFMMGYTPIVSVVASTIVVLCVYAAFRVAEVKGGEQA